MGCNEKAYAQRTQSSTGCDMSKLLFSVTARDCRWDYFRGTGAGGQKRNKTSSGVRCTHTDSGAVGQSDDTRSQHTNKRTAFTRMSQTQEFKLWHQREVGKHTGAEDRLNDAVDAAMRPHNLRTQIRDEGEWVDG